MQLSPLISAESKDQKFLELAVPEAHRTTSLAVDDVKTGLARAVVIANLAGRIIACRALISQPCKHIFFRDPLTFMQSFLNWEHC